MDQAAIKNDHFRRCFIIAPAGPESALLAQMLGDRGVDCVRSESIAPTGELSRQLMQGVADADFVVASLHGRVAPELAFELGAAHALGKPALIFTTNYDRLLENLIGIYVIRRKPESASAMAPDIDRFLRHAASSASSQRRTRPRLESDFSWARARAAALGTARGADTGETLERLVFDLFEAAGDQVLSGKAEDDRGVDMIVWNDEIALETGGPVIVECKHLIDGSGGSIKNLKHSVERLDHLVGHSDAHLALLIVGGHRRQPVVLPETSSVLAFAVEDLIDALESGQLAREVLRHRQNIGSVQGAASAAD